MKVIVSHAEDNWRYWLKLEGQRVFSGKTREAAPIDLRKIKWSPASLKQIQKVQAGLYEKLIRAKFELERHLTAEDDERARDEAATGGSARGGAPFSLAWSDADKD